jgi:hypothetical protein
MKDGLADGLARVRERVGALRGRDAGSGDRYVLLPSGAGRKRRLAELGAVAGVVVVVVAFVSAAMALRPSSAPSGPSGPGLPAPTEFSVQQSLSPSPSGTSTTFVPPGPVGSDPTGRGRPLPSATGTSGPSGTPTLPATTTRASASVPPATKPPVVTPPPSSASPTPSVTVSPSPTAEPTTEPPPPVGLP